MRSRSYCRRHMNSAYSFVWLGLRRTLDLGWLLAEANHSASAKHLFLAPALLWCIRVDSRIRKSSRNYHTRKVLFRPSTCGVGSTVTRFARSAIWKMVNS